MLLSYSLVEGELVSETDQALEKFELGLRNHRLLVVEHLTKHHAFHSLKMERRIAQLQTFRDMPLLLN